MPNVLITGATGMVGKGVLLECLRNPQIESVVLLNRRKINVQDAKIREILLDDFSKLETIKDQLKNIDACFHCMGVSSVGMSEEKFSELTFDITKNLADICYGINPKMTFNYVSGTGTDSTEKGRTMWARVKGRTENHILGRGFEKAYMFRPGFIIPENGIKSRTPLYNSIYVVMRPFFPLFKRMSSITTTTKIGQAMILTALNPKTDNIFLENRQINALAEEFVSNSKKLIRLH